MKTATMFRWLSFSFTLFSFALGGAQASERVSLTRDASSGTQLSAQLSRDEYRYVERQERYTVDVPYEVQVPYQYEETYYVWEQRCSMVPRSRQVCHDRQVCRNLLTGEFDVVIELANADRFRPPGTPRPHPQPQPPRPPQCRIERVCRTEHYHERVCTNVQVPYTRWVTRYRTEIRYRAEERVRTVTDRIFDHSWGVHVVALFPPESVLQGREQEVVHARLLGEESAPDADAMVESPVFNYRVADKQYAPGQITLRFELIAKYSPEDLGPRSISDLNLVRVGEKGFQVQFKDSGVVSRSATQYDLEVVDRTQGKVVFAHQLDGRPGATEVVIPVARELDPSSDFQVKLAVRREGVVLAGPVGFVLDQEVIRQLEPGPYTDPNAVREFMIQGEGPSAMLLFVDSAPMPTESLGVRTSYDIKIKDKGLFSTDVVAQGVFDRSTLLVVGGKLVLSVKSFPGSNDKKLAEVFESGEKLYVEVTVKRISPRLKGYSPVVIKKGAAVRVPQLRRGH